MTFRTTTPPAPNYYAIIKKQLSKRYAGLSEKENSALCREIIFAPTDYTTIIEETPLFISGIRENLAEMIENSTSSKNFIPYSLDSEIADLIEATNCETSSMNEYYRWITATADIIRKTSDNDITKEDITERTDFLTMSFDREAELLLCLALYQSANLEKNKEKINTLRFKLARLREMRSIVSNTPSRVSPKKDKEKETLKLYYDYCRDLLTQKYDYLPNFNLKLNLNINHSNDEDLEEGFSWIEHLRNAVLLMMRKLENLSIPNTRPADVMEQEPLENKKARFSSRNSNGRI